MIYFVSVNDLFDCNVTLDAVTHLNHYHVYKKKKGGRRILITTKKKRDFFFLVVNVFKKKWC